jgi:glycosyltransferase involved in cell wall biosynthesis
VKVGVVVQRYGTAINGGAELHARYVAEHLARHVGVEVLTTCAVDYVTWRNELPADTEQINGVTVRRFRVSHERHTRDFARRSVQVFETTHSLRDELKWLASEGPASRTLIKYIAAHRSDYDYFIFFSYRYYHAYHGIRAVSDRAILVPTAERDPVIGLAMFRPVFAGVRALMYNSPEERAMIQSVAANRDVPSVVVGIGSEVPAHPQPARFRQKYNLRGPFAIYVGRIDENKGCKELFQYFRAYQRSGKFSLVLVGKSLLPVPDDPRIRHLGFLDDTDKFDGLAAAEALIMPSYFESLSMVALEAWALGKPVLANAKCDVLKGQCLRSNAGLYYDGEEEFVAALHAIERYRWLSGSLGRNGRQFFRDNYDWAIIERKYLEILNGLQNTAARAPLAQLPGWLERRTRNCSPGAEILADIPAGAWRSQEARTPPPVVRVEQPLRAPTPTPPPPPGRTQRRPPQRRSGAAMRNG